MARTKSEIRAVLLSISFNRPATSTEAAILTRAARAVSASRIENNDSSASGLTFLRARSAASCHRWFFPLHERSFQLLNFGLLGWGEFAPSQVVTGIPDSFQYLAQLAGGTLGRRSGIVEFVGETCGKLS